MWGDGFGHENLDVAAGGNREDGGTGQGHAQVRDAEADRLAALRGELEAVVALEGAGGVETQPRAAFAVLCEALDGSDGRAEVSERGGVEGGGGRFRKEV